MPIKASIGVNGDMPFVVLSSKGTGFSLPLPDDIASSLQISWDQAVFGSYKALAHGKGAIPDWNSVKASGETFKAGVPLIAQKAMWTGLAGSKGSNIAESRAGGILNANKEMLFKGTGFRSFNFTWTMLPRNAKEASDIHNMIRQFQKSSVGTLENEGRMVGYPESWKITFKKSKLPDIKEVVITNTGINYGVGGKVILHKDGYPVQTIMSLSFVELTVLNEKDFPEFGG